MLSKLKPRAAVVGSMFQVLGASLASVGAGLVYLPAGLIVGGVLAITFGVVVEMGDA